MKTARRPPRRGDLPAEPQTSAGDKAATTAPAGAAEAGGSRRAIRLAAAALVFVGLAAYANSFAGVLVFDDVTEIGENPAIRRLWPPHEAMLGGKTLPPRPIPYYTFAIDYALWGDWLPGFHLTNVAIHLANALLVFGIARRTLLKPALAPRYGRLALPMAWFVAALWAVHPLQTQAVTYVYQRMECLMALCFLGGLYAFIRAGESALRERTWLTVCAAAATAGMLCKESAVALPPLVFLYDVLLTPRAPLAALRRRPWFYAALAASYLPLLVFLATQGDRYLEFRDPISRLDYALTQPEVLLRYLRLTVWPAGQCLDYWWEFIDDPLQVVVPVVVLVSLVGAYLAATRGSRPALWLLAAVVLPLVPTSSVIPVAALAAEHRMYLSLAGLAGMVVVGAVEVIRLAQGNRAGCLGQNEVMPQTAGASPTAPASGTRRLESSSTAWAPRVGVAAGLITVAALAATTHARNEVYRSKLAMWTDAARTASHAPAVLTNLATAQFEADDFTAAAATARRILAIDPDYGKAQIVLGSALLRLGDQAGALEHLARAVAEMPQSSKAYLNLGVAVRTIDAGRAAELFRRALECDPSSVEALINLGNIAARAGRFEDAVRMYDEALAVAPHDRRAAALRATALADLNAAR